MSKPFEEILISDEELEEIEKRFSVYSDTPMVNVGSQLYFNMAAASVIPKTVRWYTTSSLVIGLPTDEADIRGFKTRLVGVGIQASVPSGLREKKVHRGLYKVYKYKDGFAFKRYEPVVDKQAS